MVITINGLEHGATREWVRTAAEALLGRLRVKPTAVQVMFRDDNGPKGGVDVRCGLTLEVPRQAPLHVEATAETPRVAFEAARDLLERGLRESRERARTERRRPKKYFVANRLLAPDAQSDEPVQPVTRRRRAQVRPGRAPRGVGVPKTPVREVMVAGAVTIDASATVLEAAQRMRDGNVGMLPVTRRGRLHGVVTDRDLVIRAMARGADPSSTPLADCLTSEVISATPEWSTERAMEEMARAHVGRLPVVDGQRRVVGVVTLSSLLLRAREKEETLEAAQEVSRRSARRASAA